MEKNDAPRKLVIGILKRVELLGAIIASILTLACLFWLKSMKGTEEKFSEVILFPVIIGVAASFMVISLSFFLYTSSKDFIQKLLYKYVTSEENKRNEQEEEKKREKFINIISKVVKDSQPNIDISGNVKNLIKNISDVIKRFGPAEYCAREIICADEDHCPYELKKIRNHISNMLKSENEKKEFIRKVIDKRFEWLQEQLKLIHDGEWKIFIYNDEYTKVSPTDADMAYYLVSDSILNTLQNIWIKASTIYKYIPWWYTPQGLHYLQKQRATITKDISVDRIFFFNGKIIQDLFPSYKCDQLICEEGSDKRRILEGNEQLKKQIIWVLLLHWCLNIKVRILSTAMFWRDDKLKKKINDDQWQYTDIAIFGEDAPSRKNFICKIVFKTTDEEISNSLSPDSGMLSFRADSELEIMEELNKFALDLDDLITSNYNDLEEKISNIYKVLGYKRNYRSAPPKDIPSLSNSVIRNGIDELFKN